LGDDLCWTKKSYAASRGFIASLVRSASLPAEIYSAHALGVDEHTYRSPKWQHDGSLQPDSAIRRM
jgi:hypothetical protein